MVVDLSDFNSHKHKELTVHTQGVTDNTVRLTSSKLAKLAAIFHDLGKLNPNFQDKLFGRPPKGYGNHAYLSAYGIFCFYGTNQAWVKDYIGEKDFNFHFLALIVIIAKHHGNLPNFELPIGGHDSKECKALFEFIETNDNLPINEFIKYFEPTIGDFNFSKGVKNQQNFMSFGLSGLKSKPSNPLDLFLSTQFDFSCLIQSDKTDAGDYALDRNAINTFSTTYQGKINEYLENLKQRKNGNIELNALRTQIRIEANENLKSHLQKKERVFALTSATGSGKTLMLLSLAGTIIEETKQPLRVIYSIPFLSITEQVEKECLAIFGNDFVQRIDSKSENSEFQKLQEAADQGVEVDKDLITAYFKEDIFSYPFVITTFVRFFETLMSNRNATLLKLPSFSNCIFLIDEIQSLPPRLYSFFVAYLDAFCKKNNSYAVVSTATMPSFTVPNGEAQALFLPFEYKTPSELLSFDYFKHDLFNRYTINQKKNIVNIEDLTKLVIDENQSILVILNTIDDSKDLYDALNQHFSKDELFLLNTHFTPNDRKEKIKIAKERLYNEQGIILVSTQLIEAGVDIDFPVLYRDMAILPSIVQSAGRCNRNGKLPSGKVVLFNLHNRDKNRAELIYRGKDKVLLENTLKALKENEYSETSLFDVQKNYFNFINKNLIFGEHEQKKPEVKINFVRDINEINFETIGKFRLIDEDVYGEEFKCYVRKDANDNAFDILLEENKKLKYILATDGKNYAKVKLQKIAIENHLKKMSGQILQVRIKKGQSKPPFLNQHFELFEISNSDYSFEKGVDLNGCIL
jgi:CRISPR-associated endonuclease/helicase Cas3